MSITVRAQRPKDLPEVRDVITRAFGRPAIADLADELRARARARCYVAELDGRLVGQVQLSRSWLDAPRQLVEVLVLSPLSVAPQAQRRGVGTRLVRYALERAERLAAPAVFLEGAPDYYGRLGFLRAGSLGFTAPSTRIPDAAFQVVTLSAYRPWMSGALVYPDAFWAYDSVGLR